jgi:polyisoprenoid-binding protein YceI
MQHKFDASTGSDERKMSVRSPINLSVIALAAALLLSACRQPSTAPGLDANAAQAQHKHAHATVYHIDPQQSSILLKVYRDGPLARFGHNHVIAVGDLSGVVYRQKEWSRSDFELTIPALQLMVDRPADRVLAGADFPGELTPFAIAGTRENMLGPKLLAAEQYPDIKLSSVALSGELANLQLTVKVSIRGIETQILLPASVVLSDNSIIANGRTTLSQAQLGLNPYSVLGGGLRVRDTIDVDYHLLANRVIDPHRSRKANPR